MQDDDKEILDEILNGNVFKYEIIIHKYPVSYTHLTLPTTPYV